MEVDYQSHTVPTDYVCGSCGATGIKLWREYNTFDPQLFCARCAAKDQGEDISDIDASGKIGWEYGERTDQIGWYVPAVPDEEGDGFWGYTSVPNAGVEWWRHLPTLTA